MANLVNLRRFRKAKDRAQRDAAAQDNRLRHGTSKIERLEGQSRQARDERFVDGHRREPGASAKKPSDGSEF